MLAPFRLLSRHKMVAALIVVLLGYFLAPVWMDRSDPSPGSPQNKCEKHITDPGNDPRQIPRPDESIKIIRLTSSGEFAERCDLTNALYELNWDRPRPSGSFGVAVKSTAQRLPKLAVLYIHGWKHNANSDDSDLQNFTALIGDLRKKNKENKHIVGIYVGWTASSGLPGFLENASFWVKKKNADRIAQSSVVTKIVTSLGAITKQAPGRVDQLIAIGHSFGARMLFSATAQSLVYQTEKAHPGYPGGEYKLVEGPADAVILLNPAFEASRYTAIDDITRYDESFNEKQPPLIISISTDNDWATNTAFPAGQWLGAARSERELTTLGNYKPFFTHSLLPIGTNACQHTSTSTISDTFQAAELCLTRLDTDAQRPILQKHNPFIVAKTTKEVIDGHNGIWAPKFQNWLAEVIRALEAKSDAALSLKVQQ
jgi:hypothetical protein